MSPEQVSRLIVMIGIICQGAASLLLASFFFMLRRYAARRTWFLTWGYAWGMIAVALAAFVIGYGNPMIGLEPALRPVPPAANFIYQLAKLLAMAMLLTGTLNLVRGSGGWLIAVLYAVAAGYGIATFFAAANLPALLVWQAPAVVAVGAICGSLLLSLPESRRTAGSLMTGAMFMAIAALWAVNMLVFSTPPPFPAWMAAVSSYSAYYDLLLDVLLAFGMVLILIEDTKRESDTAHAQLGEAHSALLEEALRDSLTRVLNRRALSEGIGLEHVGDVGGSVVVFDLDNLKEVNDEHGHRCGDALLRHFVAVLSPKLRHTDALYRFGGDEFLLVIAQARPGELVPRLLKTFQTAEPLRLESGATVRLQVSLGAAAFSSRADFDLAISRADGEMYEHKRRRKPLQGGDVLEPA